MDKAIIGARLKEHKSLFDSIDGGCEDRIYRAAEIIDASLASGGKVLVCGNGGSAADSQHFAAEFVGRFLKERTPLPAIALSTNTSSVTAIGNDYGYEQVFKRQVTALGRKGDCIIGISTSGTSKNVLLAMEEARAMGMKVIGLCGEKPDVMKGMSDEVIYAPPAQTPRVQEFHIFVIHVLCELIEAGM